MHKSKSLQAYEKSTKKSFRRPSTINEVPDPENQVSYIHELSKPSIFSPSLVLMVVFDDVAAGPHVRLWGRRGGEKKDCGAHP
jgi:hypothetical protein